MTSQEPKSIDDLLREGIVVTNAVAATDMQSLIDKCHPHLTDLELIRIGAPGDGGYLVPNDLLGISACFSPGVSNVATFESDLLDRFGIQSHLADYSVDVPPQNARQKSFEKKFLGAYTSGPYISLDDWVSRHEDGGGSFDLLLQMDIEGAEYESILGASLNVLRRFRIIVCEFHDFHQLGHPSFFKLVRSTLEKIFQSFIPVHIHPNNCGTPRNINGILVPPVFEMTLLRKDRAASRGYAELFPHPLDSKNIPFRPDVPLPRNWCGNQPTLAVGNPR
jgi:hypothetical protein